MRLEGMTALITGAGTGIGRATALLFAREGARVLLAGRRPEPLEEVASQIAREGGEAASRPADVRDQASIDAAVREAVARWDRLDIVVNCAGSAPSWTPLHETSEGSWNEAIDVNLTGAFRISRAAIPHLLADGGSIVFVSSISALRGSNSVPSYSAAKAGLIALARCIAAEYGSGGIRCTCVIPSWVATPMTEPFLPDDATRQAVADRHALRRIADPGEIAGTILHLASREGSFITGIAVPVDGGMSAL